MCTLLQQTNFKGMNWSYSLPFFPTIMALYMVQQWFLPPYTHLVYLTIIIWRHLCKTYAVILNICTSFSFSCSWKLGLKYVNNLILSFIMNWIRSLCCWFCKESDKLFCMQVSWNEFVRQIWGWFLSAALQNTSSRSAGNTWKICL